MYSINGVGKIRQIHAKKIKLDHQLTLSTRINSKWIKELNVRLEIIKILEENIGSKISGTACTSIFSGMSPCARKTKKKKTLDYIKLKRFCTAEETIKQNENTTH